MKKKYKPHFYGSTQLKDKEAWKVFSRYIRGRDKVCISCPSEKADNAGHFIPGSICGKALFFSEINVNGQGVGCNKWKHGNLGEYARGLIKKHGADILDKLEQTRREEKEKGIICRFSKEELKEIEEKYKQKLEALNGKLDIVV